MIEKKSQNLKKTENIHIICPYFSDSISLYKFNNDASKNCFNRFENIIFNQSKISSIYTNICLFFLLLFSFYVNSHYSIKNTEYSPYLQIKKAIFHLLIFFIFLINKLMKNCPNFMFIYMAIVYLYLTINNVIYYTFI